MDKIDLSKITRNSKNCLTNVMILEEFGERTDWITFGQASIDLHGDTHVLQAHGPEGWTDLEHDLIYVLRLPIIGLQLSSLVVSYHTTYLTGWISSDPNDFRVPTSDYDVGAVAEKCYSCGIDHMVVPEGYYVPKRNNELFESVKGKKVLITIGPAR